MVDTTGTRALAIHHSVCDPQARWFHNKWTPVAAPVGDKGITEGKEGLCEINILVSLCTMLTFGFILITRLSAYPIYLGNKDYRRTESRYAAVRNSWILRNLITHKRN